MDTNPSPDAPAQPSQQSLEATLPGGSLDEQALRKIFGNAADDLTVPTSVKEIFKSRLKTVGGDHRTLYLTALIGLPIVGLIVGLAGSWGIGGFLIAISVITVVAVLLVQNNRATSAFFEMYTTARGLQLRENSGHGASVPLFTKGDKRKWHRVMTGTISDRPAALGHYTYTDVSTDSDGDKSETDYDFTFLAFELPPEVAARFVGVYCAPKSISFGAMQDKLAHDRAVSFESQALHGRYSIRVVDEQDDIALFELFSPPFIEMLVDGAAVYWEQRGSDLVFWQKNHFNQVAKLDQFCMDSSYVLQRYLEEYQ
ncbi:MAG: hypothetical protein ABI200_01280 [Gaiellales bacterium]